MQREAPAAVADPIVRESLVATDPPAIREIAPAGGLLVAVRNPAGEPLAGVAVDIAAVGIAGQERTAVSDTAGVAAFEGLRPGTYLIRDGAELEEAEPEEAGGPVVADVKAGMQAEATLVVERMRPLRGLVTDGFGTPVPDARVFAFRKLWIDFTQVGALPVAISDRSGRFEVPHLPLGTALGARAVGYAPSELTYGSGVVAADGAITMHLRLLAQWTVIRGRVVDEDGVARSGARVTFRPQEKTFRGNRATGQYTVEHPIGEVTGQDGRFAVCPVPLVSGWLDVRTGGMAATRLAVVPAAGGTDVGDVVVEDGVEVSCRVVDSSGDPVRQATVFVVRSPPTAGLQTALTGADGRCAFAGVPRGIGYVWVHKAGYAKHSEQVVWDGPTAELTVQLQAAPLIRGRVLMPDGGAARGYRIRAVPFQGYPATAPVGADGRFAIAAKRDVRYRLETAVSRLRIWREAAGIGWVVASDDEVVVQLQRETQAAAWLRGRVLDRNGRPIPTVLEVTEGRTTLEATQVDPQSGEFEVGPLPAGEFGIVATPAIDGAAAQAFGPWVLAASETRNVGRLALADLRALMVIVTREDRQQPSSTHVIARDLRTGVVARVEFAPGSTVGEAWVAEGPYELRAIAPGCMTAVERIDVRGDLEQPIRITLRAATALDLELHAPGMAALAGLPSLQIQAPDGRVIDERGVAELPGDRARAEGVRLTPGAYVFVLTRGPGRWTAEQAVPGGGEIVVSMIRRF